MFRYSQVDSVHLEVTDRCNAACPMCPRLDEGRPNPNLKGIEMTLEDVKRVFPPDFLRQLRQIYLCGNFGDPMVAKDTLEILRYFRAENPKIELGFHTNASARSPEWWTELGALLSHPADYCKFALDGLADTNSLYRRNTRWEKVIANIESFIRAGGQAHWEFLVFRHNEHQVEEARALSAQMGFRQFFVKKTSRFFNFRTGRVEPFPVQDAQGEVLYYLDAPTEESLVNPESVRLQKQLEEEARTGASPSAPAVAPAVQRKLALADCDCLSIRERNIYVTASGHVMPCCFIGGQLQYAHSGEEGQQLEQLIAACGEQHRSGRDQIDGKLRHPREIIDHSPWFKSVSDSWNLPPNDKGKIPTCVRQCGKSYQPFAGEYN